MNRALEIHLRLLSVLPVRTVQSVSSREYRRHRGVAIPTDRFKLERMREMDAQGIERQVIARELRVSSATIVRHLGKKPKQGVRISTARKARKE